MRALSLTAEPTTTTSPTTAGGDVTWYSPRHNGSPAAGASATLPASPKSGQARPVSASRANRRASLVAVKMRRAQWDARAASVVSQYATPRHTSWFA
jgi:hypothetical protein